MSLPFHKLASILSGAPWWSQASSLMSNGTPLTGFPILSSADHGTLARNGGASPTNDPVVAYTTVDGCPVVSIKSNLTAGGSWQFQIANGILNSNDMLNSTISMLVYVPDITNLTTLNVQIALNNLFAAANRYTVALTPAVTAWGLNGWAFLTISPAAEGAWAALSPLSTASQWRWLPGVGATDKMTDSGNYWTNLILLSSFTAGAPGYGVEVCIAGIWLNKKETLPSIILTADDGYVSSLERSSGALNGLSIIAEEYGARMTNGIIGQLVGSGGYMTAANWITLKNRGHECVIHGTAGGSAPNNLTEYNTGTYATDVANIAADLATHQAKARNVDGLGTSLVANGSDTIYVYPQGKSMHAKGDIRIRDGLAAAGIVAARNTYLNETMLSPQSQGDLYHLAPIGHTGNAAGGTAEDDNVARVILRLQQNAAVGRSSIIILHKLIADGDSWDASGLSIREGHYRSILAAAKVLVDAGTARWDTLNGYIQARRRSVP